MKKIHLFLFILTIISTGLLFPKLTYGSEINNHLGKKVTVLGENKATTRWNPIDGAKYYTVYYKVCGETTNIAAVKVPAQGNSLEIKYLNPNTNYCYRVGAMVDTKEVFLPEQVLNKSTNNNSKPVLGTKTEISYKRYYSDQDKLSYNQGLNNSQNIVQNRLNNQIQERQTQWKQIKNHLGKMVNAPVESATGTVNWSEWMNNDKSIWGANQFQLLYKACSANQWQTGINLSSAARQVELKYLEPGVPYCYQLTAQIGTKSITREGRVTITN